MLRMIAGHETVSEGDVLLENRKITTLPAAARGTAMMFQSFALVTHLSALDNVAFSLKMKGATKADRHQRAPGAAARRAPVCAGSVFVHPDAGRIEALAKGTRAYFIHVTHSQEEAPI